MIHEVLVAVFSGLLLISITSVSRLIYKLWWKKRHPVKRVEYGRVR